MSNSMMPDDVPAGELVAAPPDENTTPEGTEVPSELVPGKPDNGGQVPRDKMDIPLLIAGFVLIAVALIAQLISGSHPGLSPMSYLLLSLGVGVITVRFLHGVGVLNHPMGQLGGGAAVTMLVFLILTASHVPPPTSKGIELRLVREDGRVVKGKYYIANWQHVSSGSQDRTKSFEDGYVQIPLVDDATDVYIDSGMERVWRLKVSNVLGKDSQFIPVIFFQIEDGTGVRGEDETDVAHQEGTANAFKAF